MRKYRLEITEKRTKTVEVEGLSYKEAVAKAYEMHSSGVIDFNDKDGEELTIEGEIHVFEVHD